MQVPPLYQTPLTAAVTMVQSGGRLLHGGNGDDGGVERLMGAGTAGAAPTRQGSWGTLPMPAKTVLSYVVVTTPLSMPASYMKCIMQLPHLSALICGLAGSCVISFGR